MLAGGAVLSGSQPAETARDAVAAAVRARMGDVDVTVERFPSGEPTGVFSHATPDPGAVLGKAIWFTMTREDGLSANVRASVELRVIGRVVKASRAIERGTTLDAANLTVEPIELKALPLRALPAMGELAGAKTLRPLAAGQTIERAFVASKRAINAGDAVTAYAVTGALEVSASAIAADAGNPGDVIRVSLPGSRRYLRAKVISTGVVEVVNGR